MILYRVVKTTVEEYLVRSWEGDPDPVLDTLRFGIKVPNQRVTLLTGDSTYDVSVVTLEKKLP